MVGKPPRGFNPREHENVETQTQSGRRDVRAEMRRSLAMREESARIDRLARVEREIGSSIEPNRLTANLLRPIKNVCARGSFTITGFLDHEKVLAACKKIELYNNEMSTKTQGMYIREHGIVFHRTAQDAVALLIDEIDKTEKCRLYVINLSEH